MDLIAHLLRADSSPAPAALHWLMDASLQATLLLLLGGGASLLLRRVAAALRHLVWLLTFGGLMTLPLLNTIMPAQQALWRPLPQATPPATLQSSPFLRERIAMPGAITVAAPLQRAVPRAVEATREAHWVQSPADRNAVWPLGILALWLGGVLVVSTRVALGLRGIRQLERHSVCVNHGTLVEQTHEAQQTLRLRRPIILRLARKDCALAMPLTWGWRQPVVLLPSEANVWSVEQQRVVLLHELAHVARRDWVTMLAVQVACAFFWFHPLVWRSAHRLRAESERATDDRVLLAGVRAGDYGACLLEIVRTLRAGEEKPVSQWAIAMAGPSRLEERLRSLLDPHCNRRGVSRFQFISSLGLTTSLLAFLGTVRVVDRTSADEVPAKATPAKATGATHSRSVGPDQAERNEGELSGAQILQKSAAAYASLRSYTGTSTVVSTAEFSTASLERGKPQTLRQTAGARIQFVRPDRMHIAGRDVGGRAFTIISNGRETRRQWPLLNEGRFEDVASLELAVASMTGVAANAPTTLPAALMKLNWGSVFSGASRSKVVGVTTVDGTECLQVVADQSHQKTTFWVDAHSFLLRQIQVEQTEKQLAAMMAKRPLVERSPGRSLRLLSRRATESFAVQAINKPLHGELFQFPRSSSP